MTQMPHLSPITWDEQDRIASTARNVVGGAAPATYYCYDSAAQRVRKTTDSLPPAGQAAARQKERVYLGAVEIYREYGADPATPVLIRETLHVDVASDLVCLDETRTRGTDPGAAELTRYQHTNHLGSAVLELDDQAQIISYEEYFPYGGTSYQAVRSATDTPKRYRYTGKERDEENDLYYHGARYYAPWLGRWTSCDPAGLNGGPNPYTYGRNSPAIHRDDRGLTPADQVAQKQLSRNVQVGAATQANQAGLVTKSGSTVIGQEVTIQAGKGGSRLDAITARAGKGYRSLESTAITAWKRGGKYVDEAGNLIESAIRSRIEEKVAQVQKHIEQLHALPQAVRAELEARLGGLPTTENLLITFRGPEEHLPRVREIAQDIYSKLEGPRPGIGVIAEKVRASAPRISSAAEHLGATAISMAPGLLLSALDAVHENTKEDAADFRMTGKWPTASDMALERGAGYEFAPVFSLSKSESGEVKIEEKARWVHNPDLGVRIEEALIGLGNMIFDPTYIETHTQQMTVPDWDLRT
jgi:RHS repeat-associated protein